MVENLLKNCNFKRLVVEEVMDWSVFWEAAGAIATFLAVCVALWQTKYTNKKRLKITFVEKMCYMPTVPIGSMGYMPKTEYAGLDISNTGNRKIIVQSFGLELANGSKAVIAPETTPLGTQKWPIELDIEESAFLENYLYPLLIMRMALCLIAS